MITRTNGERYINYKKWSKTANLNYDYESNGILTNIMSKRIIDTTNPILQFILGIVEKSLIFVLKYGKILPRYHRYRTVFTIDRNRFESMLTFSFSVCQCFRNR